MNLLGFVGGPPLDVNEVNTQIMKRFSQVCKVASLNEYTAGRQRTGHESKTRSKKGATYANGKKEPKKRSLDNPQMISPAEITASLKTTGPL